MHFPSMYFIRNRPNSLSIQNTILCMELQNNTKNPSIKKKKWTTLFAKRISRQWCHTLSIVSQQDREWVSEEKGSCLTPLWSHTTERCSQQMNGFGWLLHLLSVLRMAHALSTFSEFVNLPNFPLFYFFWVPCYPKGNTVFSARGDNEWSLHKFSSEWVPKWT